jgi:hypothetical protein
MKKAILCFSIFLLGILLCPTAVPAAPIQWAGNGHYYEIFFFGPSSSYQTWEQSKVDAANRSYLGLPGTLATLTSQAENDFVYNNLIKLWNDIGVKDFWIGGYQLPDQPTTAAGWQWVTGEAWGYTNWGTVEPNDCAPNCGGENNEENYLAFSNTFYNPAAWIDAKNGATETRGYVVEYAPIPAAAWLLASGVIGIALVRRKMSG